MIEIRNVSKSFGGRKVLDGLDLTINTGESMVIIGRSGCGKSVLLKHIIGLLKPDEGQILIDGVDIAGLDSRELNEMRMKFGMLFQGAALFDSLTVFENVGFRHLEYTSFPVEHIEKRVNECLAMVGLRGINHVKPAELSGGMRKRVGLARAVCMPPEIMLFDEPTTGVDPITGDIINGLIRDLHEGMKVTSVTVTHDMKSAYRVADRIAMLYGKRIIAVGTPDEIKNSDNELVRQFISGNAKGPITQDGPSV
ncbi:MAG: ABC transporter ATP-binding protein [Candidatus Omnitrophica bacterium]|nr:ABC transporter ATP-binding protein [Candidatus Omnitrophota bacterium]MDD5487651.1 ABC transporter ATP-binding protein [Candidatus Omnitrophota bacterium]